MKTMKSVLPKAGMIFLIFTLLCGVIYTGVVTGIAQLIFPDNANGSIIEVDGTPLPPTSLRQARSMHSSWQSG